MKKILFSMLISILTLTLTYAEPIPQKENVIVPDPSPKNIDKPEHLKEQLTMFNDQIQKIAICSKEANENQDKVKMHRCKIMVITLAEHVDKFKKEKDEKDNPTKKKEESSSWWTF